MSGLLDNLQATEEEKYREKKQNVCVCMQWLFITI